MKVTKIYAKMKSDFVEFREQVIKENKESIWKVGKLDTKNFWEWIKRKTIIYDKVALVIENDEVLIAR